MSGEKSIPGRRIVDPTVSPIRKDGGMRKKQVGLRIIARPWGFLKKNGKNEDRL